jgi:cellulose synthase/poly-beta-1,6-N-acetylglucosamine synthase-like glycosyltransferase
VGYVVAPQTYGNAGRNVVARLAESCQFVFHSLIQRSANTAGCPMFVGTNYLVRIEALEAIGGMADSITEDCLTGLRLNAAGWRGVYTPDELAVGEGPEPWRDYLSQQYRWSRGAIEIIRNDRHSLRGLPWRQRLHHWTVLTYYPSVGIGWPLAIAACGLYALTGATGIVVPVNVWLTLYLDVAASQLVLFLWARRLNVSAQEEPGSSGMGGLLMGMMSAPVYGKAVFDAVLRRPTRFVVTPKGAAAARDGLGAFRHHVWWAAAVALPLAAAVALGHTAPAILTWNILMLGVCLAPLGIAAWTRAAEVRGAAADLAEVGEAAERNPA